jgi:hypothetical protein
MVLQDGLESIRGTVRSRDDSNLSLKNFIHVYRDAGMPVEPFDELLAQRSVVGTETHSDWTPVTETSTAA